MTQLCKSTRFLAGIDHYPALCLACGPGRCFRGLDHASADGQILAQMLFYSTDGRPCFSPGCGRELPPASKNNMIRILVDSPDQNTVEFLRKRLSDARFKIVTANKTQRFSEFAHREQPQIAIIDRIHERQEIARQQIAALQEMCSGVRIIAISEQPSSDDAAVIEQGVFYYLTLLIGDELIRVIEAGAARLRSISNEQVGPLGGES